MSVTIPGGACPLLLIGDHAGRAIPKSLGRLGLKAADLDGHIAWDIGIAGLGERLAQRLDATFVAQAYSRLVIDCNRRPG
ncbi:MAG: N-formylglutamate amidohydrolase, partial [Pseudomonadota bacterium]